jgi:RNA exonuclease 1
VYSWLFSSLGSFTCTAAEGTKNKNPAQHLLSVEQMVENDYPVPSYLADVFQKPEGWIETPQVAADDESSHTVYAIDCEMVRILNLCNSLK